MSCNRMFYIRRRRKRNKKSIDVVEKKAPATRGDANRSPRLQTLSGLAPELVLWTTLSSNVNCFTLAKFKVKVKDLY